MSIKNSTVELTTDLSEFIISLFRGARDKSLKEFKPWVFEHLQQIVRFDSGLWVSRSDVDNPIPEYWAEDTSLFNLPDSFMANYQRLATLPDNIDPLYELMINNPQEVVSLWDAYESRKEWHDTNYYLEHCKYFNIENMLSTYIPSGDNSSILHALSFYRKDAGDDFNESELNYIKLLLPILIEAFRINVLNSFKFDWKNNSTFRGATDRLGTIIESEEGFKKLMRAQGLLSDNKLTIDINNIVLPATIEINELTIEVNFQNGIVYFEILKQCPIKKLTKRQKEVCKYLVQGLVDKEICRELEISNSTVRFHLENIYKILNVENRYTAISYLLRQNLD